MVLKKKNDTLSVWPLRPRPQWQGMRERRGWGGQALTGEDGGHEGREHEEEHGEEEAAGVVKDLAGIVADVQVEETNEHADHHVGHEPKVGQDLCEG